MIIILDSIINIVGEDLHDNQMRIRIFVMIVNKGIHTSSASYKESGYGLDLDTLTISFVLVACFISYEKWANWKKS